jgi:hypothetical protein
MCRRFANEPRLTFADNQIAALDGADARVIVTEWREFRSPNFDTTKGALKTPVIFDGRNLYDPKLVRDMRFVGVAVPLRHISCFSCVLAKQFDRYGIHLNCYVISKQ